MPASLHDLVEAASGALSQQDAETLESVLQQIRMSAQSPLAFNIGEVARAVHVLTQQVHAAERHLGLCCGSNPWER